MSKTMSKTKHTPGNWHQDKPIETSEGRIRRIFSDGPVQGGFICKFNENDVLKKYWKGNSNLITAAPEMLDALETAKQFIQNGIQYGYINMPDSDCGDTALETAAKIERAIKKARG